MSIIVTLIVTTALAGIGGTGLGGIIGAILQKDSKRTVSLLLSFAGGVMLSVVCFDLAAEAVETGMGVWFAVMAIAVGVVKNSDLTAKINAILAGISREERSALMDAAVAAQPLSE